MNLKIYLYSSLWCLKSEAPQRSVKKNLSQFFLFVPAHDGKNEMLNKLNKNNVRKALSEMHT